MKKLVIFLAILIAYSASATPPDSCLCIPLADHIPNEDSIAVDTCKWFNSNPFGEIPDDVNRCEATVYPSSRADFTQKEELYYSKKGWLLFFDVQAIKLPEFPSDTIIDVTWESIDSSFSQLRNGMEAIQNDVGQYFLRKQNPQDSSGNSSQVFYIHFFDYKNVEKVKNRFNSLTDIQLCGFESYIDYPIQHVAENHSEDYVVYPNPTSGKVFLKTNKISKNRLPVYNLLGIYQGKAKLKKIDNGNYMIDLTNYSGGIYIIKVNNTNVKIIIWR